MFRHNLKRAFSSPGFFISAALYTYLMFYEVWYDYTSGAHSGAYINGGILLFKYANSVSYLLLVLPILAALPYATSFVSDWKSRYIRALLMRARLSQYWLAKVTACFVAGGAALALSTVIFYAYFGLNLGLISPESAAELAQNGLEKLLLYGQPGVIGYLAGMSLFTFAYGGMCALASLAISAYCLNSYVALCVPFVSARVLLYMLRRFPNIPDYFNLGLMRKGSISGMDYLSAGETMAIVLGIYLALSAVFALAFYIGLRRRIENA